MTQSQWPRDIPDSLQDICLDYCVTHLSVLAEPNSASETEKLRLRPGISLPRVLCEGLLKAYTRCGHVIDDRFLHLFEDSSRTQLKYINLPEATITDAGIQILCQHPVVELDLSHGIRLTEASIKMLNNLRKTLCVLKLGGIYSEAMLNAIELVESREFCVSPGQQEFVSRDTAEEVTCALENTSNHGQGDICVEKCHLETMRIYGRDYIFDCPKLRVFSLRDCHFSDSGHDLLATILSPCERLTHLDLTKCQNIHLEYMDCLENCPHLLSLSLADIEIAELDFVIKNIGEIKSLRHLDLSQSFEVPTIYMNQDSEGSLKYLATHLPNLVSLDISGTNLAGFEMEAEVEHRLLSKAEEKTAAERTPKCSIPGLENKQLEFLGLLGCPHNACRRQNIPAHRVTGDESEDQVLLSLEVYKDRTELLTKAFNNLYHLFRVSVVRQQYRAVEAILAGMKKHKTDKHVQISGSASLFYIVKGEEKENISCKLKRRIIEALLEGMNRHVFEQTMMRNGCLTLCHFNIPQDVLFCYDRLVMVLLKMLKQDLEEQDQFGMRIGIYLLNCLACQVDGKEKQLVGDLGAIGTMLAIIRKKLHLGQCDEIMEVAWSTMWNVTDETAMNCQRFMDDDGMNLFLQCLRIFPNKAELLRNMMGLMGNVAEVRYLRPRLMEADYINVFSDLLDSESDGIEVSYNAAGVLAHIASDGAKAWREELPARHLVLERLTQAIERWCLHSSRNINYRSFEPILRLACSFDTPEAQHWAVWALANLTQVYPEKYCQLLEQENGLGILNRIIHHRNPYRRIKELARMVVTTHQRTTKSKGDNCAEAAASTAADHHSDMEEDDLGISEDSQDMEQHLHQDV